MYYSEKKIERKPPCENLVQNFRRQETLS